MGTWVELNHVLEHAERDRSSVLVPRLGPLLDHLIAGAVGGDSALPVRDRLGALGTCLHGPTGDGGWPPDLGTLHLGAVAGVPGIVVDGPPPGERAVGPQVISPGTRLRGRAVLIRSGWDARWGTGSYIDPGPYLSQHAAERLVSAGARLVGVDFGNVDDTVGTERPVHATLLRAGIPIIEHLSNLSALPTSGFRFFAVPLRVSGGASFPVRAFAELRGRSDRRPALRP